MLHLPVTSRAQDTREASFSWLDGCTHIAIDLTQEMMVINHQKGLTLTHKDTVSFIIAQRANEPWGIVEFVLCSQQGRVGSSCV